MLASFVLLSLGVVAAVALAQPPEGGPRGPRDRGDGPRGDGPPPPPPIIAALDADHDGTISADEIAGASEALKSLDKNDDGKLSGDEIHPPRPRGPEGRGPEGRGRRGDGPGEFGPGAGQRGPRGDRPRGEGPEGRGPRGDRPRGDGPRGGGPGRMGPGGPPPFPPPHLREELDLSDEQVKQIEELHKEMREKFENILTEEQRTKLKEHGPPARPPRD